MSTRTHTSLTPPPAWASHSRGWPVSLSIALPKVPQGTVWRKVLGSAQREQGVGDALGGVPRHALEKRTRQRFAARRVSHQSDNAICERGRRERVLIGDFNRAQSRECVG